jgi:isochorismate hydrolase
MSMEIGFISEPTASGPDLELRADRAVLLVIDWQERLAAAIPPAVAERGLAAARLLVDAATRLGVPIVVSEQYPKGLGPTVAPLLDALAPAKPVRLEKLSFSCVGEAPLDRVLAETERTRPQWIVCGMEAHVCVYQTARALARNRAVFVAADAALSRRKADWKVGMRLLERGGCVVSSSETIVFDLLKRAEGADFKALSKQMR